MPYINPDDNIYSDNIPMAPGIVQQFIDLHARKSIEKSDIESIKRLILDSVDYSMLYILAGFTFPHWKFTRYPDDKLKPFDYTMDIGIVKTTPEIIVHLKRIFDKI